MDHHIRIRIDHGNSMICMISNIDIGSNQYCIQMLACKSSKGNRSDNSISRGIHNGKGR